ncbi:MAG: beta-glucanase (GH16 family) [Saprospiraceae bacterium]|jgi:beta-glucanase (GH16 family)
MDHFFRFTGLGILLVLLVPSCNLGTDEEPQQIFDPPQIFVSNSRIFEQDGGSLMIFEVASPTLVELPVSFTFKLDGITATPDEDFIIGSGSSVIGVGSRLATVTVNILDDDIREVDEKIKITITGVDNATIARAEGIGTIFDSDAASISDGEGYITSDQFFGYDLAWEDSFDEPSLNLDNYNFDLADGCPDLCTWGNAELQWYTDEQKNVAIQSGKLVMTATKSGAFSFNSGRINTKGKREFQFGRIDIRAKLPFGQGLWPAIWMLGANIDDVGWPASGEIDIMEMVGHLPHQVLGTAHWGPSGGANSTFKSGAFNLEENFSEQFHVFSIVWEENEITWYVDEQKFHTITPADMQGQEYRFNQPFYFLFNVAVGGNFPGNPDETTIFPQAMEIDYVRVFQ